jgi:hypothetical protein
MEGDEDEFHARPASFYRRAFAEAGLLAVGSHAYLLPPLHDGVCALERGD